jgi:hypothetical protein
LSSRRVAFEAAVLLVVSLGLMCEERIRREGGQAVPAIGMQPGGWLVQLSFAEGAGQLLYMWDVPEWTADGIYTGERVPVGGPHEKGLKLAGFALDLQLQESFGRRSPRPHARLAIPYWFVAALTGAWLFAQWCWHWRARANPDPREIRGWLAYRGAFPWFLTCLLWCAAAALLWCTAPALQASKFLQLVFTYPLFPLAGVLDPVNSLRDERSLLLYAAVFWVLLFGGSLAFSQGRATPALPALVLVVLGCGASFAAVLVA